MSVFKTTVSELAERFGLAFHGEGDRVIDGVGTLAGAGPSQLSFLSTANTPRNWAARAPAWSCCTRMPPMAAPPRP